MELIGALEGRRPQSGDECRYFAGLGEEETAEALGVSLRTAQRAWMRARAWLRSELGDRPGGAAD